MPNDSNDRYYTESMRFGPKNERLRSLNRNRDLSGVRGYPSDREYMRAVDEAGTEKQQNEMRQTAINENSRLASRKGKRSSKKSSRRK